MDHRPSTTDQGPTTNIVSGTSHSYAQARWRICIQLPCGRPPPPRLMKASQPDCKTHEDGTQNLRIWIPKWPKKRSKIDQKSIKNRSWGFLGGSWGPLNPKMAPRAKKTPKSESFVLLLSPILEPKIDQNRSQERSEMWSIFWSIWRSSFGAIWCQLGPILAPKTSPKWSQVGVKIDPSWGVDLRGVFWCMLGCLLLICCLNMAWPKSLKS